MNYLVDNVGEVVAAMQGVSVPQYMYGHPTEIALRLTRKDTQIGAARIKYPLIALRLDATEELIGGFYHYNLNLVIVTLTSKTDIVDDRYEKVFKPVLYPLYKSFMQAVAISGLFTWDNRDDNEFPPHIKTDRPYYGTTGANGNMANIFNDPLDAIEITNLKLKSRSKLC